jgi:hypothetical protein
LTPPEDASDDSQLAIMKLSSDLPDNASDISDFPKYNRWN